MGRVNETVKQAVDEWKAINRNRDAEVVGAIWFSEGALVLSLLVWQQ